MFRHVTLRKVVFKAFPGGVISAFAVELRRRLQIRRAADVIDVLRGEAVAIVVTVLSLYCLLLLLLSIDMDVARIGKHKT